MKYLLSMLALVAVISCKQNPEPSIFRMPYQSFKEIPALTTFEKVIVTVIDAPPFYSPKYRLLHLKSEVSDLVLFDSISSTLVGDRVYHLLDTLHIMNLRPDQFVTLGYCYSGDGLDQNIIAMVEKTDSIKIATIIRAWRADTLARKIEHFPSTTNIHCVNEFYTGKRTGLP